MEGKLRFRYECKKGTFLGYAMLWKTVMFKISWAALEDAKGLDFDRCFPMRLQALTKFMVQIKPSKHELKRKKDSRHVWTSHY